MQRTCSCIRISKRTGKPISCTKCIGGVPFKSAPIRPPFPTLRSRKTLEYQVNMNKKEVVRSSENVFDSDNSDSDLLQSMRNDTYSNSITNRRQVSLSKPDIRRRRAKVLKRKRNPEISDSESESEAEDSLKKLPNVTQNETHNFDNPSKRHQTRKRQKPLPEHEHFGFSSEEDVYEEQNFRKYSWYSEKEDNENDSVSGEDDQTYNTRRKQNAEKHLELRVEVLNHVIDAFPKVQSGEEAPSQMILDMVFLLIRTVIQTNITQIDNDYETKMEICGFCSTIGLSPNQQLSEIQAASRMYQLLYRMVRMFRRFRRRHYILGLPSTTVINLMAAESNALLDLRRLKTSINKLRSEQIRIRIQGFLTFTNKLLPSRPNTWKELCDRVVAYLKDISDRLKLD